jgi:hypothetical protein
MARYNAYLLRLWRDGRADGDRWAARLEHLPRGDALHFTDRAALLAYMEELIDAEDPACARDTNVCHMPTCRTRAR